MDFDPDEIRLPEPAPSVIAFDAAGEYTLDENIYMCGPMLLVKISEGASIDIMDGPPWEASSNVLCRLSSQHVLGGGVWVGIDCYVISDTATRVHAQLPSPYKLELRMPHASYRRQGQTVEQSSKPLSRTLERLNIATLGWEHHDDHDDLVIEVPLSNYQRIVEVLSRMRIAVTSTSGQLQERSSDEMGTIGGLELGQVSITWDPGQARAFRRALKEAGRGDVPPLLRELMSALSVITMHDAALAVAGLP